MDNIGILDAGIIALLGYAVVFFGLILLMIIITVMGKIFVAQASKKKAAEAAAPAAPAAAAVTVTGGATVTAPMPGTILKVNVQVGQSVKAGQLKLYDTPPKTAAMIMAIVADKMGKPLNELRFISIKEVK